MPVGPDHESPEVAPSKAEELKQQSRNLRGQIAGELAESGSRFSKESAGLLKFHGLYQQEDRDVRKTARAAGGEKHYMFMVRSKIPGGRLTAEQYLAHDELATRFGNGTLRITSRQDFQLHGVIKGDLQPVLRALNERLITTLGACGDIARNVVTCPSPAPERARLQLQEYARQISAHTLPKGRFYHEIWIDGELATPAEPEAEPLYGRAYLPRKFKTGIAFPGDNCIDVYTHDLGFVPALDGAEIEGFTLLAGGGLGMTHHKPETYPRLADPIGFIRPRQLLGAVEAVIGIHRDFGDRLNRRHARLKYIVEELGVPAFRVELSRRLGEPLGSPRPLPWHDAADHLGWNTQADGVWFLGLPVENGRIQDMEASATRSALRAIVARFGYEVRLTPQQNLLLCGIRENERSVVMRLLREHGVPLAEDLPNVVLDALACPALPTCGLALAESERVSPALVRGLAAELDRLGLGDERISVRMTGCPNGCARPYTAEIGFVGKTAGVYDIYTGGDFNGTRLARVLAENVPQARLVTTLAPIFEAFRDERQPAERFGDYCARAAVLHGDQLVLAGV